MTYLLNHPFLNSLINACAYYSLIFVLGWVILFIHDVLTPGYKTWVEIARGNVSAGLAAAGQIVGISVIAYSAIQNNWTLTWALIWTAVGGLLLIFGYLLFELLTPRLNVSKEIAADNRAVGLLSMAISIGASIVVASCIS
jgi:putative membrane protein